MQSGPPYSVETTVKEREHRTTAGLPRLPLPEVVTYFLALATLEWPFYLPILDQHEGRSLA